MILKKINIQNLGFITHFSYEFTKDLNILRDYRRVEISFAIRLILGHKIPPPLGLRAGVETRVLASVSIFEKLYTVSAYYDKNEGIFKLSCLDTDGFDVTGEYLYSISHSREQDLSEVFEADEDKLFLRFLKYANAELYYSHRELSELTDGMSDIKAFRAYLRSFICNFEPEILRDGIGYEIVLERDGRYAVRCMIDGSVARRLSESERTLFKYLCFLRTAEFWHGFEELRNINNIKKPLIISDFLDRLDESIDIEYLLDRTRNLNRQTILLTTR